MSLVLRSLFDDRSREQALAAVRSVDELAALRADLESRVLQDDRLGVIPPGDTGNNLLMALLSLRVKFPESEAFAKLETNIAMREQRGGRGAGT